MTQLPPLAIKRAHLAYLHDMVMTAVALCLTLWLRVGDMAFTHYLPVLWATLPALLIIATGIYYYLGMYRGIWRYASLPDLNVIVRAVTVTVMLATGYIFILKPFGLVVPRSLPLILWLVLMLLLGAPRLLYRMVKDKGVLRGLYDDSRVQILILGANSRTEHFIRALQADADAAYRVAGIIDMHEKRVGRMIRGVNILGTLDQLEMIIARLHHNGIHPQRLVIADNALAADGAKMQDLLTRAAQFGLTLSRLPHPAELNGTDAEEASVRPVAVEDLLGRPQAALDLSAMQALVANRRVLVTGAGGTIGGELANQIAALNPAQLLLLDNGEFNLYRISNNIARLHAQVQCHALLADVRDQGRISAIFDQYRPEIVFHAAALKHVNIVEQNPAEGILTNVMGAQHVADAAFKTGTKAFVFISTDKAIKPASIMGASKRLAELYCQALDVAARETGGTRFITVRFGNVLGSSGSVVPLFQEQLAKGGPLTVTHPDMKRYFMTVKEAVELVLQASAHGLMHPEGRGAIFVLDMGAPVKIVDLAAQMIRLAGLRPDQDIKIEFTGIQPGEKLFEEILDADENPQKIDADGLYLATPVVMPLADIAAKLAEIYAIARLNNRQILLQKMSAILPHFGA